jgi:hypothetical protein
MDEVATKARKNEFVDVSLADDVLQILPLKKATPPSAVAFAEKVYSLMPHVKITEVLGEVDGWTRLAERFVHMRTLAPPKHRQALLTAVPYQRHRRERARGAACARRVALPRKLSRHRRALHRHRRFLRSCFRRMPGFRVSLRAAHSQPQGETPVLHAGRKGTAGARVPGGCARSI